MWPLWVFDQFYEANVLLLVGAEAAKRQAYNDHHGLGARLTWLDPSGDEYVCHGWVA